MADQVGDFLLKRLSELGASRGKDAQEVRNFLHLTTVFDVHRHAPDQCL